MDDCTVKLNQLLAEKKIYLNPDLTRKDLAGELNHSEVQISLLFKDGLLQGSLFEEHEIRNYDFIIIPPEDNLAEKHY